MRIYDLDGEIILEDEEHNLKIISDRTIYYKKKSDRQYKSTEHKVREGLSSYQKKVYLILLSQKITAKKEVQQKNRETSQNKTE